MYAIENKFEIGEECYSVYRKPVQYGCPICKGDGKFEHNGYDIYCRNCDGTGKVHHNKETILDVCKVKISSIKASMSDSGITIRYRVNGIGEKIKSRAEISLFKTKDDAEKYCMEVNTKQVRPEF